MQYNHCALKRSRFPLGEKIASMPELRGKQATEDVKDEWKRAYQFYMAAPGVPHNKKLDRTERINYVAEKMHLTRKQAKRRVKNFEAWQRNIKKGLITP